MSQSGFLGLKQMFGVLVCMVHTSSTIKYKVIKINSVYTGVCRVSQGQGLKCKKQYITKITITTVIIQQLFLDLESDWLRGLSTHEIFTQYCHRNHFTVCITPLAVFLTVSVMADAKIHYNFINNTVFVLWNVALRVPDLTKFAAGSDVSMVVKHEIICFGVNTTDNMVSLIYYLFHCK